jgi:1,6-anhydro-N-acetylmuramate kinase
MAMSSQSIDMKKPPESGAAATFDAADGLRLAAAPAFAIMAVLASLPGGGQMPMICGGAQEASLLTGMVPMYLLMGVFHSAPWLKRIANRRQGETEGRISQTQ